MKLLHVSIVIFYKELTHSAVKLWVQERFDDGPFHGLLEFPGGKIEAGESPFQAGLREVQEEVDPAIIYDQAQFLGHYENITATKRIVLYPFLVEAHSLLAGKGQWLSIDFESRSTPFQGKIPHPNHPIIDDLCRYLYDRQQ